MKIPGFHGEQASAFPWNFSRQPAEICYSPFNRRCLMRAIVAASSFLIIAGSVSAAPVIAPNQAAFHVGACMTVEGHASMFQDSWRPGIDIDLDGESGGGAPFMAYVPYPGGFPGLQSLDGQNVDITGIVMIENGKPAIQLNSPEMIMPAGTDLGKLVTCDND
jgi:hypothetical protein